MMDSPSTFNLSQATTLIEDNCANRSDMFEKLFQRNEQLANEMKNLLTVVNDLKASVATLQTEKDILEHELNDLNAYSRRNNIEIRNIPEKIKDDELEEHCLKVFKSLKLHISHYDITTTHRIGRFTRGRTRSVLIRFVNRKHAYHILDHAKHLINTEFKTYFVTENLCPTYRKTFNLLYKGKKNGTIDDVWSYNGIVYAKMTDEDEKAIVHSVKNAQLFLKTALSRKAAREVSDAARMEYTSSIPTSDKHIYKDIDFFHDASSVGSSTHEDDINANGNVNVSGFSADTVTWWDLSKAVFNY